jgi:hypothetical protein
MRHPVVQCTIIIISIFPSTQLLFSNSVLFSGGTEPAGDYTLREEHRLGVFKNRVLRIFRPKRDEVTGGWRKLHNEELHGLYSSPGIIRVIKARMRWAEHMARMGEVRNAYSILVGKSEGRRPLGRPSRRWEDNIGMDLRGIGVGDVDWIHLAQDRDRWWALANTVMNLRVP